MADDEAITTPALRRGVGPMTVWSRPIREGLFSSRSPERSARLAAVATLVVVAMLVSLNVAVHVLEVGAWLGPVVAVLLVVYARWSGLSWSELGLGRERLGSGVRWAMGAVAVIAGVYVLAVLLPATRAMFLDDRYHLSLRGALLSAFVVIPAGTVVVEEIAFRSVLWGMLARHARAKRVLIASSALFGLWHILPSLHLASSNRGVGDAFRSTGSAATVVVVAATVGFTAIGGAVAGELRRRSGSLLASVGMHWATNALGVLFGVVAWRLAG